MKIVFLVMVMISLLISGCQPNAGAAPATEPSGSTTLPAAQPSPTMESLPATEEAPTATQSIKPTLTLPATPTEEASATAEPAAPTSAASQPSAEPAAAGAILIDHRSVELFERIPERYITAASQIRWLFRHASVGANIEDGLNCLMNREQPRPFRCDRDIPADEVIYDAKYDRSNWTFEFHTPPPNPNPGWTNKVNLFIQRVDGFTTEDQFEAVSFKLGYVDALQGSNIDRKFFADQAEPQFPRISDLEALESRHPDLTFVYWTIALARLSFPETWDFNQHFREYAREHGKILIDIADIESHRPDGTQCMDANNTGVEALCQDYTTETEGGHLNALGSQRMAKAVWVLMARLAGWDGISE